MHVVLLAAQSLDGKITRQGTAGDAFASEADGIHFRDALAACDACVMGRTTYELSKDRLRPERRLDLRRVVWTRSPVAYASAAVPGALEFTDESPLATATRLRMDGRRRCAVLGGAEVNTAWLRAGLVDEVWVTVESWVFGSGVPLALEIEAKLHLLGVDVLAAGGPVCLRYAISK
ncbi:MAG: dihydrofolate reductase [Verrucomicrobia bacterium]|nr:MAG: dihydrofolate reductase [Verrucomicrobiota bacterium]